MVPFPAQKTPTGKGFFRWLLRDFPLSSLDNQSHLYSAITSARHVFPVRTVRYRR